MLSILAYRCCELYASYLRNSNAFAQIPCEQKYHLAQHKKMEGHVEKVKREGPSTSKHSFLTTPSRMTGQMLSTLICARP